jgi:hypothetical protein
MILLIISLFILVLCLGGALMESKIMDKPCMRLFDMIRGGVEYEDERL